MNARQKMFNYDLIPSHCMEGLRYYIDEGYRVGGFLEAIISNNLEKAVSRADEDNLDLIPTYVAYIINEAPAGCFGSKEIYNSWKGLKKQ